MFGKVNITSREKEGGNYLERLASVKNFFKNFRVVKWIGYRNAQVGQIYCAIKHMESPFNIPKMLVHAKGFFNPESCLTKRISSGIKMTGSGARSILWMNGLMGETFMSQFACEFVHQVAIVSKMISTGLKVAYATAALRQLSKITPKSQWEVREKFASSVAWSISFVKNILKLLLYTLFGILLAFGSGMLMPLMWTLRAVLLMLAIVDRFTDKNAIKCAPNNLWGGLRCQ